MKNRERNGIYVRPENRVMSILTDYKNRLSDTPTPADEDIYQRLADHRSNIGRYYAGAVALDVATRGGATEGERSVWFSRSYESWQGMLEQSARTGDMPPHTIRAAIGRAGLNSYHSVFMDKTLPNRGERTKMYDNLNVIGNLTVKLFLSSLNDNERNKAGHTNPGLKYQTDLSGTLAELAVLMLHQRYTLREEGMETQLALMSRESEDSGGDRRRGSPKISAWDVSVYQQDGPEQISMPYKIQVKASRNNRNKKQIFGDDISVVYVRENLAATPHERRIKFSSFMIVNDLVKESHGAANARTSELLDNRTEQLLERIDQPFKKHE